MTAKRSYQKARRSNKREAPTKNVTPIERHPKFQRTKVESESDWWALLNTMTIRYEVFIDEEDGPQAS
jgi:hypothetical protein